MHSSLFKITSPEKPTKCAGAATEQNTYDYYAIDTQT